MEKRRKTKISFYVPNETMDDYKSLDKSFRKIIRLNCRDYLKLQIYKYKVYSERNK